MAIESTNFFSFLKSTRSPIGLVDQYNLSEIYDSDQRTALVNLLLDPEGLDQISGLTKEGLQKEDLRLIGGLKKPVIDSLALFHQQKSAVTFDLSTMVRVGDPIGEPGKHSFVSDQYSDNVVILHGGLAAKNIEYDFLDENGEVKTTTVSTSRESLFNSQVDPVTAKYTNAIYPGLLRVRRRSHINTLKLNNKLFVEKSAIVESPSAKINLPIYMRTGLNTTPSVTLLQAFATKNSPFTLFIKVSGTGSFSLGTGVVQANNYYFGYEIRRKSDNELVLSNVYSDSKSLPRVPVSFNLNGTIGNNQECVLYIYCAPALIKELNLSGLGLKEDAGKDIGLIGFDNLEILDLSGNDLSTIPVWIKANYKTLKELKLDGNDYWNNGIVSYFDYQTSPGVRGSANQTIPPLSAVQLMSYSGYIKTPTVAPGSNDPFDATGKLRDYEGTLSTVVDGSGTLGIVTTKKYVDTRKNTISNPLASSCSIDESNGFRVFSALKVLTLRSSFRHNNPDFSKVFPGLTDLVMNRPDDDTSPNVAFGLIPRLNNNGELMSYNIRYQRQLGGNIKYAGAKTRATGADDQQFIGQFKMKYWDSGHTGWGNTRLCGGICTNDNMVGNKVTLATTDDGEYRYSQVASGVDPGQAWSGWLNNLQELHFYRNDIAFNIAEGTTLKWNNLKTVNGYYNGETESLVKIKYNTSVSAGDGDAFDILNSNKLEYVNMWNGGWGGRIFSINQAPNLTSLYVGYNGWEGYENGKYLLPANFAKDTTILEDQNKLYNLQIHYVLDGATKNLQFRSTDFTKLGRLRYVEMRDSYFTGVFPPFVDEAINTDIIDVYLGNNRFHDLSNLGTTKNNRFQRIWAPNQGIGRGGAILPSFKVSGSNNRLHQVEFYDSLDSKYSSNWNVSSKRNKPIFNLLYDEYTTEGAVNTKKDPELSGITQEITTVSQTFTSVETPGGSQKISNILQASSNFALSQYIRVGDKVLNTSNKELAIVTQIVEGVNSHIYVSQDVDLSSASIKFKRAGQNISKYFNNCTNLYVLYLQNCSLVGTIPNFSGNNGRLVRIRFQNNLLRTYQTGTLQNITGAGVKTSKPGLTEFNLSYNALSKDSIRSIISDAYDVARTFGNNMNIITIDLRASKADLTSGNYINWTEDEIFTEGTPGTPGKPGDPNADPPIPEIPGIPAQPDPLFVKYNQLGFTYPKMVIKIFN